MIFMQRRKFILKINKLQFRAPFLVFYLIGTLVDLGFCFSVMQEQYNQ